MSRSTPSVGRSTSVEAGTVRSARPTEPETDEHREGLRHTRRWQGVSWFALVAIGTGLLVQEPALLLASVPAIAFVAASDFARAAEPDVDVDREVDPTDPAPGESVSVTLTVRNEGDRTLTDLRVVDGIPEGLEVASGSPRLATALRPGEHATVTYEIEAARGTHAFDPVVLLTRDPTGATEYLSTVDVDRTIVCTPALPEEPAAFPLRPQTTRFTGRSTSNEGGEGVEFHATREYRVGDPLGRIDWKRTARTRDLTTVEHRQERAAAVLLVVDARAEAYVAPEPDDPSAVDRGVDAAREIAASLLGAGHTVGLTALSPEECWLSPGRGIDHRVALRNTLASNEAFDRSPPDAEYNVYGGVRSIRERISGDTQIVFVSPMVDERASDVAIRLDAHGHATSIVCPDPTTDGTAGQQVTRIERTARIAAARHAGIPVVDWQRDETFERALARTRKRWSA